jgi:membrane protease YdiL (CAAX protease family)
MSRPSRALVAELILAGLLLAYGPFSVFRLVLLLVLATQSLWIRDRGWSDLGLRRPASIWRTVLHATAGALIILVSVRFMILPIAARLTGTSLDLSALGEPGDSRALATWMLQAWSLAAFGEEMVFRGYLIRRITGLVGDTRIGLAIALAASSVAFGIAHAYQGPTGVVATGIIGLLLGLLYLYGGRNLWTVILCHGMVDTAGLLAIYFDQRSLLFP